MKNFMKLPVGMYVYDSDDLGVISLEDQYWVPNNGDIPIPMWIVLKHKELQEEWIQKSGRGIDGPSALGELNGPGEN